MPSHQYEPELEVEFVEQDFIRFHKGRIYFFSQTDQKELDCRDLVFFNTDSLTGKKKKVQQKLQVARLYTTTYTLGVVDIASQPHGHFCARPVRVVFVILSKLFLWLLLLHLRCDGDTGGRPRGAGIDWLLWSVQWFSFDRSVTRHRRHALLDRDRLRQLI